MYGSKNTLVDSEPHIIERFLKKRPSREDATFNAYGIQGIPHTFLIAHKVYFVGTVTRFFYRLQTDFCYSK